MHETVSCNEAEGLKPGGNTAGKTWGGIIHGRA